MDDIISQGEERPPAPRWRRVVIALAVLVVGALVLVEHLPHGHQAAAPKPQPRPGRSVPTGLTGILGSTARWAAGVRLPRAGHRPDWFWPGQGKSEPILGLPDGKSAYLFSRVAGGWAVLPEGAGPPSCGDCPEQVPVYYLASHSRSVTKVAEANMAAPGAGKVGGHDTMWLTSFPTQAGFGTVAGTTREYSVAGQPIGAPVVLPVGYTVVQGTPLGLLLVSITQISAADTYQLWDPRGGRLVRTFTGVIAVSAHQVALRTSCSGACPVQVLDLMTGRQGTIKVANGESVTYGVFSPDSRYLALEVTFGDDSGGGSLGARLEVASTATDRVRAVPHTSVSSDALTDFGWPTDRDGLVAEFSFTTRSQMARSQMTLWTPQTAKLAVAGVRHDQNPTELVVG